MLRDEIITVFGGSGFVGRHVVRALARAGYRVRVASRRPHLAQDLRVMGVVGQVQLVQANLRVAASVDRAVDGASGRVVQQLHRPGRDGAVRGHHIDDPAGLIVSEQLRSEMRMIDAAIGNVPARSRKHPRHPARSP